MVDYGGIGHLVQLLTTENIKLQHQVIRALFGLSKYSKAR